MREPEPDQAVEHADEEAVVEAAERHRDLGKDVLGHDQERDTMPAGDHDADGGDERWVGQAQNEIRPGAAQARQERQHDEAEVVEAAKRKPAPVERRRPDAHDANPVPHRPLRLGRGVDGAGHDGDVVLVGERLAQLGQELSRGLVARRVVLVQDEQGGPRRRHHRRMLFGCWSAAAPAAQEAPHGIELLPLSRPEGRQRRCRQP